MAFQEPLRIEIFGSCFCMNRSRFFHGWHWAGGCAVACCALMLTGCARIPDAMTGMDKVAPFSPDDFDKNSMYTRHMHASASRTCEAARRALLSQGYLVDTATEELVTGRKFFQPSTDIHYEVTMRVVCTAEGKDGDRASAYASALQDRYVIKKINNSASLGVGALGSVSLPVSATDDTLVKVGSETVSDPKFYERFFELFKRYVPVSEKGHLPQDTVPPAAAKPAAAVPDAAPVSVPVQISPVQLPRAEPMTIDEFLARPDSGIDATAIAPKSEVKGAENAGDPTTGAKPEPKPESGAEPQVQTKVEPASVPKAEPKAESAAEIKAEPKAETKAEPKAE